MDDGSRPLSDDGTRPAPGVSFLEAYCKRTGQNPKAVRAEIAERQRHDAIKLQCLPRFEPRQRQVDSDAALVAILHAIKRDSAAGVPLFLAKIQTVEQFKAFVLDLILPDLVDIIEAVMEEKQRANQGLPGGSPQAGVEEATTTGEAVADAGVDDERAIDPGPPQDEEIPF